MSTKPIDWDVHIRRRFNQWVQFGQENAPEIGSAVASALELIAEERVTTLLEFLSLDIEGLWE